ncbi:phage tail assembly protein [Paracoccus sp. 22332]|uniref:phage tail assembly protein n=1 Tax=Paracoccus sp. 22332 TaxID=3453913 RepID=UPI003F87E9C0
MADKPTITLSEPIELGEKVITTVTLRTIKTKSMRKISAAKDDFETSFQMVCAVTGLADEEVDELTVGDFTKIAEAAADFLPQEASSPNTGSSGGASSQTSPAS